MSTFHTWKYLHNITHIDHQFHSVDNAFVFPSNIDGIWEWNTTPYQESIQMFALIPIVFGFMIFLIAYCVLCICCCSKHKKPSQRARHQRLQSMLLADDNIHRIDSDSTEHKQRNIQSPIRSNDEQDTMVGIKNTKLRFCASILRFILSFITILLVIFCIFIGYYLDKSIIDVESNWDNSYSPYDTCINDAYNVSSILNEALIECKKIKNTSFPSTECSEAADIANETETYIGETLDSIQRYLNEGEVISWGNSASMDKYRKYLIYIGLSVLCFIALIVIISMNNCLLSMILIIWIISSIQFALSVSISDVCAEPESAILQAVNVMDDETLDIVKYYIYCDVQHIYNPLINYTQNAYNTLLSLNQTLHLIMPYTAGCDINTEAQMLLDDYDETLYQTNKLLNDLKCANINAYLHNITSDLCVDAVNYCYLMYSAQMAVVILLVMRACCICSKSDDLNNEGYDNVEREERIHSSFISPPPPSFKAIADPYFSDDDVRKCIAYLLPYIEKVDEMENKGNELQRNGYKNSGVPLHSNLLRKATAILNNYRLNQDSQFVHPLLKDIV